MYDRGKHLHFKFERQRMDVANFILELASRSNRKYFMETTYLFCGGGDRLRELTLREGEEDEENDLERERDRERESEPENDRDGEDRDRALPGFAMNAAVSETLKRKTLGYE